MGLVSEGQGRGRQSLGEKKVNNILPFHRWSWHRSLFFAGPLLLVIERIGFLDPVSFLTNRNWHGSSQTQRFPLLSKPEAPELGKASSRPWESLCEPSAVPSPSVVWKYFPRVKLNLKKKKKNQKHKVRSGEGHGAGD